MHSVFFSSSDAHRNTSSGSQGISPCVKTLDSDDSDDDDDADHNATLPSHPGSTVDSGMKTTLVAPGEVRGGCRSRRSLQRAATQPPHALSLSPTMSASLPLSLLFPHLRRSRPRSSRFGRPARSSRSSGSWPRPSARSTSARAPVRDPCVHGHV